MVALLHPKKQQEATLSQGLTHSSSPKKPRPGPVPLVSLLCLLSLSLASLLYQRTTAVRGGGGGAAVSCDRRAFRTDICVLRGDIRTHSSSSSLLLLLHSTSSNSSSPVEIRPYPRKWEPNIMAQIQQLALRPTADARSLPACDVRHNATAVVFSTGGYTGNLFHEFNEGIIPLYLTTRDVGGGGGGSAVVLVLLQYKNWWFTKYADVLSQLSDHPVVNFSNDSRTHCFPEATVGLRVDGDLAVGPEFRQVLDRAYRRPVEDPDDDITLARKPKLAVIARNGSRALENEAELVGLAEEVGFSVVVLRPDKTTELARLYGVLNSSDVMTGVHGAAMTHFLFMRPGSVFIQIVPLGTEWAAEAYYGRPARKWGLRYLEYKVSVGESSLSRVYEEGDEVLRNPKTVNSRGWEETKRVYLDAQNVRLDLGRFRVELERAYWYSVSRRRRPNL